MSVYVSMSVSMRMCVNECEYMCLSVCECMCVHECVLYKCVYVYEGV